jgi:hypothetical protein
MSALLSQKIVQMKIIITTSQARVYYNWNLNAPAAPLPEKLKFGKF